MNPSKVHPPVPGRVLERELLLQKLHAWEDRKLVIIHGPAGQGKSTLAAEYARSLTIPCAWYTVSREDDDPAVLLSGLGHAVRRVSALQAPDNPLAVRYRFGAAGAEQGIARWVEQLFGGVIRPLLIVLDDLDSTAGSPLHALIIGSLLDRTPPSVRVMLVSRTRPDLKIAGLRAKRSVGEIAGPELRFSDDEALNLFTAVLGMRIDETEARAINGIAEGWPAGLVLMHEYLASSPRNSLPLPSGRRHHPGLTGAVFEYLAQEVFSRLTPDIQRFLLRTSIVEYLTPGLMELLAGAGVKNGGAPVSAVAEELQRRNLFVSVTDARPPVLRYHSLFREFLRKTLETRAAHGEVKRLSTAAAGHLVRSGDVVSAVDILLSSRQYDRALKLIEGSGRTLIASGRTQTLLGWIDMLPEQARQRPWSLFFRGVALRFTDPRVAFAVFERSLRGFQNRRAAPHRTDGMLYSLAGVIEACFHAGADRRKLARAASLAKRLLGGRKNAAREPRARLLLALGMAHFFTGRLTESADALSRSLGLFLEIGDRFSQIQCAVYLAPCAVYLAEFGLAREAVRKGFEALAGIPEEKGGEAALHTVLAMAALNEGRFEEARECVEKCEALAREHGFEAFDFLSLDIGGWLRIAEGEHDLAEKLLERCRQKGLELGNGFFSASSAHLLALNALHRNRTAKAEKEIAAALSERAWSGSALFRGISITLNGAVSLRTGDFTRARRELTRARALLGEIGAVQQEADAHLLLAKLALLTGRDRELRKHLEAGFRAGRERGFLYYGAVSPDDLIMLAERALELGICTDHCGTLLRDHLRERASPAVRIRTLGGFQVLRGHLPIRDVEWKSSRAKTFLKLLAANDGGKLLRESVREILWQNDPGCGGPQGLSGLLRRVRKLLAGGGRYSPDSSCVVQDGELLALNRATVWTDSGEFLRRVQAAERMAGRKEHETALRQYDKAFELYQGDFLADDLYDDWAVPHRERIRSVYQKALDTAAALTEKLKGGDGAAVYYEKLFSNDLCNENACRWLMAHHSAAGRRTDAIRAYERCQRALERELEAEPEEETRKLYRRIVGG